MSSNYEFYGRKKKYYGKKLFGALVFNDMKTKMAIGDKKCEIRMNFNFLVDMPLYFSYVM